MITVDNPGGDRSLPVEIEADRVARTRFIDVDRLINPLVWYGRLGRRIRGAPTLARVRQAVGPTGQNRFSKLYR